MNKHTHDEHHNRETESPDVHAASHVDDVAAVSNSAPDLAKQVAELTEALQRERADSTNIRRRHAEDMAGLHSRTKATVVKDLLPVIDNFERALKHVPEDLKGNDYVKGVQGVVKQFEKTLQSMGIERIATVGEPFDPQYHEAVAVEEGDGQKDVVSEELQSGYVIDGNVVRPAIVKVKS